MKNGRADRKFYRWKRESVSIACGRTRITFTKETARSVEAENGKGRISLQMNEMFRTALDASAAGIARREEPFKVFGARGKDGTASFVNDLSPDRRSKTSGEETPAFERKRGRHQ